MILEASIFLGDKILDQRSVEICDEKYTVAEKIEMALRYFSKEMDFMYPLWLEKNTKEFSRFRQTIFFEDQFQEKIFFDRLCLKWVEK